MTTEQIQNNHRMDAQIQLMNSVNEDLAHAILCGLAPDVEKQIYPYEMYTPKHEFTPVPIPGPEGSWTTISRRNWLPIHAKALIEHFVKLSKENPKFYLWLAINSQLILTK